MSQITLLPATKADIPTLARMAGDAFATDRHTILKSMPSPHSSPSSTKPPYSHEEGMKGALGYWISISDNKQIAQGDVSGDESGRGCVVLKAVQRKAAETGDAGNHIMGWVCWGYRGLKPSSLSSSASSTQAQEVSRSNTPSSEKPREHSEDSEQRDLSTNLENQTSDKHSDNAKPAPAPPVHEDSTAKDKEDSISRLEALTDADMNNWTQTLMPEGTSSFHIISIVVAPEHQGAGVGSALVRYGTDRARRADEELNTDVFCWVHSSEAGVALFEKEGFREVGRLKVELDEFAGGREVPDDIAIFVGVAKIGWGSYVFRYLKWTSVDT